MSGRLFIGRPSYRVEGFSGRVANNYNPVAGPYTWTPIPMATEYLDTGDGHAASGNSWTVHRSGWYEVSVLGHWTENAAGYRGVLASLPNDQLVVSNVMAAPADATSHGGTGLAYLNAGEVVTFYAQHSAQAIVSHYRYASSRMASGMDVIFLGT